MSQDSLCEVYTTYDRNVRKQFQCNLPAIGKLKITNPHTKESKVIYICVEHNELRKPFDDRA